MWISSKQRLIANKLDYHPAAVDYIQKLSQFYKPRVDGEWCVHRVWSKIVRFSQWQSYQLDFSGPWKMIFWHFLSNIGIWRWWTEITYLRFRLLLLEPEFFACWLERDRVFFLWLEHRKSSKFLSLRFIVLLGELIAIISFIST